MTQSPKGVNFQRDIPTPLSLSAVCKLWRSITHSTPALWARLSGSTALPGTSPNVYNTRNSGFRIQDNSQIPISIQITLLHPSVSLSMFDPLVDEMINLVNNYSHSWGSLEISVESRLLHHFHGLRRSAPILKTLILLPTGSAFYGPPYAGLLGIHSTAHFISVGQAFDYLPSFNTALSFTCA